MPHGHSRSRSDPRRLVHRGDFPHPHLPPHWGKGTGLSLPHRVPMSWGPISDHMLTLWVSCRVKEMRREDESVEGSSAFSQDETSPEMRSSVRDRALGARDGRDSRMVLTRSSCGRHSRHRRIADSPAPAAALGLDVCHGPQNLFQREADQSRDVGRDALRYHLPHGTRYSRCAPNGHSQDIDRGDFYGCPPASPVTLLRSCGQFLGRSQLESSMVHGSLRMRGPCYGKLSLRRSGPHRRRIALTATPYTPGSDRPSRWYGSCATSAVERPDYGRRICRPAQGGQYSYDGGERRCTLRSVPRRSISSYPMSL